MEQPTFEELSKRIRVVLSGDNCTDIDVACWSGYVAALLEWGLISISDHDRLRDLLPRLDPDPTLRIFLG